jgi:hypothetical protein
VAIAYNEDLVAGAAQIASRLWRITTAPLHAGITGKRSVSPVEPLRSQ